MFQCEYCDKSYKSKTWFDKHINTIHSAIPYLSIELLNAELLNECDIEYNVIQKNIFMYLGILQKMLVMYLI